MAYWSLAHPFREFMGSIEKKTDETITVKIYGRQPDELCHRTFNNSDIGETVCVAYEGQRVLGHLRERLDHYRNENRLLREKLEELRTLQKYGLSVDELLEQSVKQSDK